MTDDNPITPQYSISPKPDYSNRLAYALSMIFHPYVVFIPPAVIALGGEGFIWALIVGAIVVTPIAMTVLIQKRSGRYVFQRESRTALYIIGWIAVLVCFALLSYWDAPQVIRTGTFIVILWTPLQFTINTFVTKASVHASLMAISFNGLWTLGYLSHPLTFLAGLVIVFAVAWARKVSRNHTTTQIILGLLTGTLATLLTFLIFD